MGRACVEMTNVGAAGLALLRLTLAGEKLQLEVAGWPEQVREMLLA